MIGGAPRILFNLVAAVIFSVAVFGVLAAFEYLMFDRRLLAEGDPGVDVHSFGRTLIALLLSLLVVGGLYGDRDRTRDLVSGVVPRWGRALAWTALALTIVFTATFAADPIFFSELGREDRTVEWASALGLFAASGLLFYAFLRLWRTSRPPGLSGKLRSLCALLLAAAFLVIGMEEISWMQRVLEIETPASLMEKNAQQELNFHNILTGTFEVAYYLGAFCFLILLPFVVDLAPATELPGRLSLLVPSRFVVAASAPLAAFNYDMWDILPIQMSMMMTVLVLLFYAVAAFGRGKTAEVRLFAAAAIVLVASQLVFLVLGEGLVRIWDPTEYKELFIAAGLACFALEVAWRLRAEAPPARSYARTPEGAFTRPTPVGVASLAGTGRSTPAA